MTILTDVKTALNAYKRTVYLWNDSVITVLDSYLKAIERADSEISELTPSQQLEIKRIFIDIFPVTEKKNPAAYTAWLSIIKAIDLKEFVANEERINEKAKGIANFYGEKRYKNKFNSTTSLFISLGKEINEFKVQDEKDSEKNSQFKFRKTLQKEIHRYHGVRRSWANPAITALENFANSNASKTELSNDGDVISDQQKIAFTEIFIKNHLVKKSNQSYKT